jgi:hypothetical protein
LENTYSPGGEGDISRCHLWEKNMKRWKRKKRKMLRKREKTDEKREI